GARPHLRRASDRFRAEGRQLAGRSELTTGARIVSVLGPLGRAPMRAEWVQRRRGLANVTQMHFAREGVVTDEMRHVAQREGLDAEVVRSEVARGRMIIPANVNHPELEPMAIGVAANGKINANIGNSQIVSDVEGELVKLRACLKYGADTVMDLSTGGDIPHIRDVLLR